MAEGFLRIFIGMVAGWALLGAILGVAFAKQNRKKGAPAKKEKDSNGEVWIYETTSSKIVPEKTVEKVTKRDAEGRPSVTESETFPAHEKISIRTKYFFFDSNARIYDTKYDWDTIDKR